MQTFKYLKSSINKRNWLIYFLSILATITSVLLTLIIPIFIRFFIDSVLNNDSLDLPDFFISMINNNGGIVALKNNFWISAVIVIILHCLNSVFIFTRERSATFVAEDTIKSLKDRLYNHIQKLPFDYINKAKTGDLIQRCTSDLDTIRKFIGAHFIEITRIIILTIVSIILMFQIHVRLTLVSIISLPVIVIISLIFSKKISETFLSVDEKESEYTTTVQENLTGMRVVRAFGREKYELEKFSKKNDELRDLSLKMMNLLAVYWSSTDVLCYIQIVLVLGVSIMMAYNGEITIGTCNLFLTYEIMLIFPVRQLGRILSDMGKMRVSLKRVFEILEIEEEQDTEGAIDHDLKGDIVFENVSFKFEDSDKNMLKDISFIAKRGQTVAILGSTGSGKSTLMHLLLRLYDYNGGSIKINNVELRNIKKSCVRNKIGMVLQDAFLFSKSIKENIKMAKYKASDSDIYKVTRTARVHDVIEDFDEGYETLVGEHGVTLSGGQKQRIAIARTLIKESDIMIFDDSLSAVDTETDQQIRNKLKIHSEDSIKFLISQRITTLMEADMIIVLENGQITDSGTHEQLSQKDGLYKRIWDIQSKLENEFDDEVS